MQKMANVGMERPVQPAGTPDETELAAIHAMTVEPLAAEELFVFSVTLCDNEIDRDYQRFTIPALERLAELFLGRTGIFDHEPRAKNQAARIFKTEVKKDPGRITRAGEPYHWLAARAYMLRGGENERLIKEIQAGIKKEVSVGVQMGRLTCSICGCETRQTNCGHHRGEWIDGKLCHQLLEEPTDAYEWSFVAVPAQRAAGVTKLFGGSGGEAGLLKTLEEADGAVTLSKAEAGWLAGRLAGLEREAEAGRAYLEELRRDVIRLGYAAAPELPAAMLASVAERMDARELRAFRQMFAKQAGVFQPVLPQLGEAAEEDAALLSYKI